MEPRGATICAGLIVRNVERVLPRCLASLRGVVDGLYVVDTGSTDGTLEIVERARADFARVDFEIFTEASERNESGHWRLWDFSAARNRFVDGIDRLGYAFVLWMDADDELVSPALKDLARDTTADAHGVQIRADTTWTHHRLWRTGLGIRFHGRCHEYPDLDAVRVKNHADIFVVHHGGADPQEGEGSLHRNLRILEREMKEDPSSRCAFYLGNTYRELGRMAEAADAYQRRVDFGVGYADEFYFALLYQGRCLRSLGQHDRARGAFLRGAAGVPGWSEFWMALADLEYGLGRMRHALGYCFVAMDRPIPSTLLWREKEAYLEQPAALAADIYGNRRLD